MCNWERGRGLGRWVGLWVGVGLVAGVVEAFYAYAIFDLSMNTL